MFDPTKWHAIFTDDSGFVIDDEDIKNWVAGKIADETDSFMDTDLEEISVVRGTAVPVPQSKDPEEEFFRRAGSWRSTDVLYRIDADEIQYEEILPAWERAKAVAEALNEKVVL